MLRVRYYTLESNLITNDIKIVNITDVHSDVQKLTCALDYANEINADIITIAGDLFDSVENENNQRIVDLLTCQSINVYISIGNHDLISFDRKGFFAKVHEEKDMRYFNLLKSAKNIKVFTDNTEVEEYENILLTAFDPGYSWYYNSRENKEKFAYLFQEYLSNYQVDNKFRIMLLHSCNGVIIDNELKNEIEGINLILSGHNHAGQMPDCLQRFSKNNRGIISPFSKFFVKGCYGFWTNNNTSVILSNGLTKMGEGHGPAFLCKLMNAILKDDIEVINLTNGDEHKLSLTKKELKKRF